MAFPRISLMGISLAGVLFAGSAGFGLSQSLNWNKELVERRVLAEFVGPVLPLLSQGAVASAGDSDVVLSSAPGAECLEPGAQFLPACAVSAVGGVAQGFETPLPLEPPKVEIATVQGSPDPAPGVAPVPAPLSHRPVLVVYPASYDLIRVARSVSGDPLVHDDAPGSWPRRLDQVNALAGAEQIIMARQAGSNIFLRNWVETRKGIRIAEVSP